MVAFVCLFPTVPRPLGTGFFLWNRQDSSIVIQDIISWILVVIQITILADQVEIQLFSCHLHRKFLELFRNLRTLFYLFIYLFIFANDRDERSFEDDHPRVLALPSNPLTHLKALSTRDFRDFYFFKFDILPGTASIRSSTWTRLVWGSLNHAIGSSNG